MSCFNVHFFVENTDTRMPNESYVRHLIQNIAEYLEYQGIYDLTSVEPNVEFVYSHPRLPYSCKLVIMKSTILSSLYSELDPKFLDMKFHMEIDVSVPSYIAKDFLKIAKNISERFNLYSYSEFMKNPAELNLDFFMQFFETFKPAFLQRNIDYSKRFYKIPKSKMNQILRYLDDKDQLEEFYSDAMCAVPKYKILLTDDSKVKFAISWLDNTSTVFPPYIDYVYFKTGELIYLYDANELLDLLDDYLENIPGFIKEAKVISKVNLKKAIKVLKKSRLIPKVQQFRSIELTNIIDDI